MKSLPYLIIAAVVALAVWFLVAVPRIELAELGQAIADTKVLELQRLDVERVDLIPESAAASSRHHRKRTPQPRAITNNRRAEQSAIPRIRS